MKLTISQAVLLMGLGVIAALILMHFDLAILQYVLSNDACKTIFDVITEAGRSHWYLVPAGLIFLIGFHGPMRIKIQKIWYTMTLIFLSVAASGIFVNILKPIFARARPRAFLRHEVTGFFHWHEVLAGRLSDYNSFPSGHAATALSAGVAIALCLPEKYRWARIPLLVIFCIIAISRAMVGVHYASDVIIGSLIGIWAAVLCQRYLARAEWAAAISRPATLQ